jgi:hypothetical protein
MIILFLLYFYWLTLSGRVPFINEIPQKCVGPSINQKDDHFTKKTLILDEKKKN